MPNWREIPFVRILLPLVAGILTAVLLAIQLPYFSVGITICFIGLVILSKMRFDFPQRWVFGSFLNLFLFLFGIGLVNYNNQVTQSNHFSNLTEGKSYFIGKIINEPRHKNTSHLHLEIIHSGNSVSQLRSATGKLLVYLETNQEALSLEYGDLITWVGYINPIEKAKNPHAFDYQQFMSHRHIHHQSYVKSDQWKFLHKNSGNPILKWAYTHRKHLLKTLRKHLPGDQEYAVASALILGHRSEISTDLQDAYSDTGAMHVLAVSGLHVGLVYLFLAFFLGKLKSRNPIWRIARSLIFILSIWVFALLTGLSPSVTRAAIMFSFIIIGKAIDRHNNIYNTIACSAFLLLILDPHMLFYVGFQLSYLALIGIVYYQPRFYKLLVFENSALDKIWSLITVSLAAQLLTFPISMYYFHQFPLLFWLSGVIVVPAAMAILPAGILLILFGSIPVLGAAIGKILYGLIWTMNALIFLLQSIPGTVADQIWLSAGLVLFLYLIIVLFTLSFRQMSSKWIIISLLCLLCYVSFLAFEKWQHFNYKSITIYSLSKQSAIDFTNGLSAICLQSDDLTKENQDFSIANNRMAHGTKNIKSLRFEENIESYQLWKEGQFIQFDNIRFTIIDTNTTPLTSKLVVDYILVKDNPKIKMLDYLKTISCELVIFDNSNSYYSVKNWKEECDKIGQRYYDTRKQGAYVLKL